MALEITRMPMIGNQEGREIGIEITVAGTPLFWSCIHCFVHDSQCSGVLLSGR